MSTRILAGRYELLERIGSGGMAVVYKARDRMLNRFVAIKILKPEFTKDIKFIENFRRESQAAAGLSHPNVVVVYDVGREGNVHYIAMELVEGEPLSELIEREAPLDYKRVIDYSKQIASALSYAHKHQIIHRDVKPHNIMLTEDGATAKITDFGIAKPINSSTLVGNTGTVMGSVHYFSPEQARGGYVDEKSDIYSLGIVMYEMLTGKVPFDGDNPVSVALMHINNEPVPPSKLVSGIPPRLEHIVMKAMDKIQVNRYKSADELIEALEKIEYVVGMLGDDAVKAPEAQSQSAEQQAGEKERKNAEKAEPSAGEAAEHEAAGEAAESGKEKPKKKKLKINWKKIGVAVLAILLAIPASRLSLRLIKSDNNNVNIITPSVNTVTVPDLRKKTFEEAEAVLTELGLEIKEGDQVFSELEAGLIVSQNPEFGASVKEGKTVSVSISKGVREGTIPNIVGGMADEARSIIQRYNYKVGNISYEKSNAVEGIVIRQTPESGTEQSAGAYVSFVVSLGQQESEVKMPFLIGTDIEEAKRQLEDLGLSVGELSYGKSVAYEDNEVMWQGIEADKMIEKGTAVDLKISATDPENTGDAAEAAVQIPITIDYSRAANQVFYLTVTVADENGTRNLISNQQRTKDEGSETVVVSGSGAGTVTVIMDNNVVMRKSVDFESGAVTD